MQKHALPLVFILIMDCVLVVALTTNVVATWTGTVYIQPDGSVDPPTSPVHRYGDYYAVTDNIEGTIHIEHSNRTQTTIDGTNHAVSFVLSMWNNDNVTLTNTIMDYAKILGGRNTTIFRNSMKEMNISSHDNSIVENTFNLGGRAIVYYGGVTNTVFYHNNLLNGTRIVFEYGGSSGNLWDDGYPSGGNYWSDYEGVDFYHGPYQNLSGSDGIGDTPYAIKGSPNPNDIDRYPLMFPWGSPDTIPPRIHVLSPTNDTYLEDSIPLRFTLTEPASWIGYSLDGKSNITIPGNTTLLHLAEGKHTLTVCATDDNGNTGQSNPTSFTVHASPPYIRLISPEDKAYSANSVLLNFTVDEPIQWIGFSLDGRPNVTLYGPPSIFLSGVTDGRHSVFIFATDMVGHTGANGTYFSIDTSAVTLPGSMTLDWPLLIIAAAAFLAVGVLIGYAVASARAKKESLKRANVRVYVSFVVQCADGSRKSR